MKYLKKTSIVSSLFAFVICFSFSAAQAQVHNNGNNRMDSQMHKMHNKENMVKGKVVDAQNNAVSNATITIKSNGSMRGRSSQNTNYGMRNDTNDTSGMSNNTRMRNNRNMHNGATGMREDTTVTTDRNGEFTLNNMSSGKYTFKVKKDGYNNWQNAIWINSMNNRGEMNEYNNDRNGNNGNGYGQNNGDNQNSGYGNNSNSNEGSSSYTKSLYLTIKLQGNNNR